jgi:hypothetical protein
LASATTLVSAPTIKTTITRFTIDFIVSPYPGSALLQSTSWYFTAQAWFLAKPYDGIKPFAR